VLAQAAALLWQDELQSASVQRRQLAACYLAHAAVERAKIDCSLDVNSIPAYAPGPGADDWFVDLDPDPGDNFVQRYRYEAAGAAGLRTINGIGQVVSNDAVPRLLAEKHIRVDIENVTEGAILDGRDDDPADNNQTLWSWVED
jgi:hypothetical protein